jgi:4-hydroxy-4-methyl-2-oxoglutarate aldolase
VTVPALTAATVHEACGQQGMLPSAIRPIKPGLTVSGPAYTVACAPRDNLALHRALATAPAGSVLVCHTAGWPDAGYFGDVMTTAAMARGLTGLVIDGCVRDWAEIDFPVFSRGLCVGGTTKDPLLPSAVGCRLRIGTVDIDPGDLVIGDDDGVVIVPAVRVDEVTAAAHAREAKEEDLRRRLRAGATTMELFGFP